MAIVRGPSPRGWGKHAQDRWPLMKPRTIPTRVGKTTVPSKPPQKKADHPHAGGENYHQDVDSKPVHGPSPRGWGKQHVPNQQRGGLRTIPTRVGKTRVTNSPVTTTTDHPHAGGENVAEKLVPEDDDGPSPRGWGKLIRHRHRLQRLRTIPTRVGKTISSTVEFAGSADHPHAGGENVIPGGQSYSIIGPSPRGWGKRELDNAGKLAERTIPTRVGKTLSLRQSQPAWADHPHAGGENSLSLLKRCANHGPSPRGWGKRRRGFSRQCPQRTIPTRVGKTQRPQTIPRNLSDHPHAGGENCVFVPIPSATNGPSPRGWGKRNIVVAGGAEHRTIPTRVGKTTTPASVARLSADHPHAGGENAPPATTIFQGGGPSPRGWGKPARVKPWTHQKRTIPTRVGKTRPGANPGDGAADHPHAGGENNAVGLPAVMSSGPSPRGWGKRLGREKD